MMDFDIDRLITELRQKSPTIVQAFLQETQTMQKEIVQVIFKNFSLVTRSEFDQQQCRLVELERRCIALEQAMLKSENTSSQGPSS